MPVRKLLTLGLPAIAVLLASCQTPELQRTEFDQALVEEEGLRQEIAALRAPLKHERRIHRIGWPILKGATELCGEDWTVWHSGLIWHSLESYAKEDQEVAKAAFDVTRAPQVRVVVPGGAAELAGVQPGDVLTAIDGRTVGDEEGALERFFDLRSELVYDGYGPITYSFERDGVAVRADIRPDIICDYPIVVTKEQALNAYADGSSIYFTRPMMRFQDDYGLAVIFGHELAHNVMSHVEKQQANMSGAAAAGFMVDMLLALGGVNTGGAFMEQAMNAAKLEFSPDFEAEADVVGLYVLAMGGYPVEDAPRVWREMASEFPSSIYQESTHPPTAERYLLLEQVGKEITAKITRAERIFPTLPADWKPKTRDETSDQEPVVANQNDDR